MKNKKLKILILMKAFKIKNQILPAKIILILIFFQE